MAASAYLNLAGHGVGIIGPVARGLPHLGLPEVHFRDASLLLSVAGSCFVVIVAQSAATARAYASSHHQSFDENSDLVGLGAANIMASLSGTFVVNGSPTQTTMVESSGGKSQIAHLSAAAVVALVALFLAGPLRFLPQCVLGAVVFTIAIRLIDIKGLRAMRRESPGEFNLAVATAAVVVVIGVEEGIVLAMVLSLLRIVAHSYRPHTAVLTCDETGYWRMAPVTSGAVTEPGIVVYYFGAPLYYANAQRFAEEVQLLAGSTAAPIRWLIVDSGAITHIDYTAARVVRDAQRQLARAGVGLALAHVQADLKSDLDRHNLTQTIGESHIFDRMHNALSTLGEKK
jgi:MFS superfamily sulfate permease-like transporter